MNNETKIKRTMTQEEANEKAVAMWGYHAYVRANPFNGRKVVGVVTKDHGFKVRGNGRTWNEAFKIAAMKEAKTTTPEVVKEFRKAVAAKVKQLKKDEAAPVVETISVEVKPLAPVVDMNETKTWNYSATKITTGEVFLRVTPLMSREALNQMLHRWNCNDAGFWQYALAETRVESVVVESVVVAKPAGLTQNEVTLLKSFANSEYHDGRHPVGDYQWFDNPFESKTTCGGVMASLSKKGFARETDSGTRDHAACITQEGWDALLTVDPVFCAKFDGCIVDPFRKIVEAAKTPIVETPAPIVKTPVVVKKKPDVTLVLTSSDYKLLKMRLTSHARQWLASKEVR
jgi:hypothetical protein